MVPGRVQNFRHFNSVQSISELSNVFLCVIALPLSGTFKGPRDFFRSWLLARFNHLCHLKSTSTHTPLGFTHYNVSGHNLGRYRLRITPWTQLYVINRGNLIPYLKTIPFPTTQRYNYIYPMYGSAPSPWCLLQRAYICLGGWLLHFNDDRQTPLVFSNTQRIKGFQFSSRTWIFFWRQMLPHPEEKQRGYSDPSKPLTKQFTIRPDFTWIDWLIARLNVLVKGWHFFKCRLG